MKIMRKIIEINDELCDGCGQCILGCAEGALELVDGKARVVSDMYCDGLGACIGECPAGALKIVEREAEEFDETAVEARLAALEQKDEEMESPSPAEKKMACGCPSSQIQIFAPLPNEKPEAAPLPVSDTQSELSHWPVQIRLIPPHAPFLKHADILVLADCCAVAYPMLHQDLLRGKVVMMGCPKFDDAQFYIERFAEIFKTAGIQSITTVYMEVPCCSALPSIVRKGLALSGTAIPLKEIIITRRGEKETAESVPLKKAG